MDLIPEIEADPALQVLSVRGTRSAFLEMNVQRPPFDDVRVRQAMNYAVDVDLLIEYVLAGLATPIPSLMSPDSPFYLDIPPTVTTPIGRGPSSPRPATGGGSP